MDNLTIVIADEDKEYIYPLLSKILQKYGQSAEIAIFTQQDCLKQYLNQHFNISVLVISEYFDVCIPSECNVAHRIILTDRGTDSYSTDGDKREVFFYKYSPLELLFHVISSYCGAPEKDEQKTKSRTSVILINSASGGTGKTVIALALAMNLNSVGKKALYLDAEWLQNFGCFLSDGEQMTKEEEGKFMRDNGKSAQVINMLVRTKEALKYFPQLLTPLVFLDKTPQIYVDSIKSLVKENIYDYIIVDSDESIDYFKTLLMGLCNQVVWVTTMRASAEFSAKKILKHVNLPKQKIHIVCNKTTGNDCMDRAQESYGSRAESVVCLPELEHMDDKILVAVASHSALQELTFRLM